MPFLFIHICDLLDELDALHIRDNPLLPRDLHRRTTGKANQWLKDHKFDLNAFDTEESAVLWILRPDKLTDREYGIDTRRLELIIARVWQLPNAEYAKLQQWRSAPHKGDLGLCAQIVRQIMRFPDPSPREAVTVEEIQSTLLHIASFHPMSSSPVKSLSRHYHHVDIIQSLGGIYARLGGREAKWFTRYILKNYRAIMLPDSWEMESGYLGLPNVAKITINMYVNAPPIQVMIDGSGMVKGQMSEGIPRASISRPSIHLTKKGWPKRPIVRSREASPVSPPVSFAKGILMPKLIIPSRQSTTSSVAIETMSSAIDISTEVDSTDIMPRQMPLDVTLNGQPPTPKTPKGTTVHQQPSPKSVILSNATTLVASSPACGKTQPGRQPAAVIDLVRLTLPQSSKECRVASSNSPRLSGSPTRTALSTLSTNALVSRPAPLLNKHAKSHRSKTELLTAGTGLCQLAESTRMCPFTRCIFVLSPGVAATRRVIQELLPWHGCLYTTSAASLAQPGFPVFCSVTHRRYRKIILVDVYSRKKTVEFLKQTRDLDLQVKVPRGKRKRKSEEVWVKEWLEVFDWRILESVGKIDQGKQYEYDVWKRNFIGTI